MKKVVLVLVFTAIGAVDANSKETKKGVDCYDVAEGAVGMEQAIAIGPYGMGEPLSYEEEFEVFSQAYDSCYEVYGSQFSFPS